MALPAGILLGLVFGILIHLLSWRLRERYIVAAALLGAVCVAGIGTVAWSLLPNPYVGKIHGELRMALGVMVLAAVVLGLLHARVLAAPWWACTLAVFVDVGLGLGAGTAGAVGRDWLVAAHGYDWQPLHQAFNTGIPTLALTLLGLLLFHPLLHLRRNARKKKLRVGRAPWLR
ncbi:MAG: hypothetical protein IBX71_01085 [Candidatus Desulforudis sp.]|nr:hypothetical protein [Desulforudis sp.]